MRQREVCFMFLNVVARTYVKKERLNQEEKTLGVLEINVALTIIDHHQRQ